VLHYISLEWLANDKYQLKRCLHYGENYSKLWLSKNAVNIFVFFKTNYLRAIIAFIGPIRKVRKKVVNTALHLM
jgi:hypothetical protein